MLYIFKKTIETLILRLCIPCSIFTFYTAGYLSRKGLWCVRGLGLSRTCLSASLPLGNSVLSLLLQDPPFCPLPLDNVRVCGHQRVICRRLHIHLYPHQRNRSTHVHSPSVSEDSRDKMFIDNSSTLFLSLWGDRGISLGWDHLYSYPSSSPTTFFIWWFKPFSNWTTLTMMGFQMVSDIVGKTR